MSVRPNFNTAMHNKWLSILADPAIPTSNRREWYKKACVEYETWRFEQIIETEEDSDAPPLLKVDYANAIAWLNEMKQVSKKPQSLGIVNEESRQLSNNMEALANNNNSANQEGMFGGEANIASLNTAAPAAVAGGAQLFPAPTPEEVRCALAGKQDDELLDLLRPKKRAKKEVDENEEAELARRREAAKRNMALRNLSADAQTKGKKRCKICYKCSSFQLDEKIPHKKITTLNMSFCPLADDHEILKQFLKQQLQEKSKYDKSRYTPKSSNENNKE